MTLISFVQKKLLDLHYRSNELTTCGLILASASIFTAYSVIHKVVTSRPSIAYKIQNVDANFDIKVEMNNVIDENPVFKDIMADHDFRSLVLHASDQANRLRMGASAKKQIELVKKKLKELNPEEFKEWLNKESDAMRLKSRSYPVDNMRDVLKVVKDIHPALDVEKALKTILRVSDHRFHILGKYLISDNFEDITNTLKQLHPDLKAAELIEAAKTIDSKAWPLDMEGQLNVYLGLVRNFNPKLSIEKDLLYILSRNKSDRVDRFRMLSYGEKTKLATHWMEEYLLENIPPEVLTKLKDNKEYDKFISRLPHKDRHWWSATWRWLLGLLATQKPNNYTGENFLMHATRPTTGILNYVFFGPIAEPLKLTVDHVSSRFMHKMTGKPWRPGALVHLGTTYLVGGAIWTMKFTYPFLLGPLAEKKRQEAFEEGLEDAFKEDPEAVAKRKELAERIIYDQRFHRYYIDKKMVGEANEAKRFREAPLYMGMLEEFYEKSKENKFKTIEEHLAHPVFYKEKEYAEKGFPLELEQTQYLRSMKFNVSGNAYRYKKPVSGDAMKLSPDQLARMVELKTDYLLISEAIFKAKKIRETEGLGWEDAISKYLDSVPVDFQMKFMDFFGATSQSTTALAVAKVLNMGIDNGVRDEEGNVVFTMDNNRIVMMLQALANADMEWKVNEVLGREMNRKKQTPSGSLVYDPTGAAITKEQYIGRMPSDMLFIIKSIDEDEAKAEAYQNAFDRMSEEGVRGSK